MNLLILIILNRNGFILSLVLYTIIVMDKCLINYIYWLSLDWYLVCLGELWIYLIIRLFIIFVIIRYWVTYYKLDCENLFILVLRCLHNYWIIYSHIINTCYYIVHNCDMILLYLSPSHTCVGSDCDWLDYGYRKSCLLSLYISNIHLIRYFFLHYFPSFI